MGRAAVYKVFFYKTKRGVWSDVNVVELPETESQQAARAERARRHAERIAAMKEERSQAAKRKIELDELIKKGAKLCEKGALPASTMLFFLSPSHSNSPRSGRL